MVAVPDFGAWGPADWEAFGTNLTVLVAAIAAVFAYHQVREARRLREEQAAPFVVVDIQPSDVSMQLLNLVIENVGTTLARDVQITFTPPLRSSLSDSKLAKSTLFSEGIQTFPPRRRIEFLFDQAAGRFADKSLPLRYDAVVSFKDSRGRPQEALSYVIDLGYLYGLEYVEQFGQHHMAKALREIHDTLRKWTATGRGGGLRVWTRSEDARAASEAVEHDLTGYWPSLGRKAPPEIVLALGRNIVLRTVVRLVRERMPRRAAR